MKQEHEKQKLRKQLDNELAAVHFNDELQREVLQRACPPSFWNRELRIPGFAAAIILCVLIAVPVIGWKQIASSTSSAQTTDEQSQLESGDKLIVLAGGVYYESELLEGWSRAK